MQKHIDRYLKKAHLQAVGKNLKSKIAFMKFLKKMVGIFNKIYPEITIDYPKDFKEFFYLWEYGGYRRGCRKLNRKWL